MNEILHEIKFWSTLYVHVFFDVILFDSKCTVVMANARNVHRENVLQNHVTVVFYG